MENNDGMFLRLLSAAGVSDLTGIDIDAAFSAASTTLDSITSGKNSTSIEEVSDDMDAELDKMVDDMDVEMDSVLFQDIVNLLEVSEIDGKERTTQASSQPDREHHRDGNGYTHLQLPIAIGVGGWSLMAQPPHHVEQQDPVLAPMPAMYDGINDRNVSELLHREIAYLEAHRDFLQFRNQTSGATSARIADTTHETYRQRALQEKQKLEAATHSRQLMLEYLVQEERSSRDLEMLIKQSPLNQYRISLTAPFETYIHLGKGPVERRATLLAIKGAKIASVLQYIEYHTRQMDPEQEFFYLDTFEKFGKYYMADVSISMIKHATVQDVARAIIKRFVLRRDADLSLAGSVFNREIFDSVENTFLHTRDLERVDLPNIHAGEREFAVQESNIVYYCQAFNDVTVMTCDYINEDELHPYRLRGRIRRDMSTGIVLTPHFSSDGVHSVIMKSFGFIKHHLQLASHSPDLIRALSTSWLLRRQSIQHCMTKQHNPSAKKINMHIVRHTIPV